MDVENLASRDYRIVRVARWHPKRRRNLHER